MFMEYNVSLYLITMLIVPTLKRAFSKRKYCKVY